MIMNGRLTHLRQGLVFQDYLAIIPRARMGSESMAHEAEGGIRYSLTRGHEGEGNICFVNATNFSKTMFRDKASFAS